MMHDYQNLQQIVGKVVESIEYDGDNATVTIQFADGSWVEFFEEYQLNHVNWNVYAPQS